MTTDFTAVAKALGGSLTRSWPLTGGVSANVHALELRRGDDCERVVIRSTSDADSIDREHRLLRVLADRGLPVPRPLAADLSCTHLAEPYLVLPFVEGTTDHLHPEAMAEFLATLHGLDVHTLALPAGIPTRIDAVTETVDWLPADLAHIPLHNVPPTRHALLHGDYWPGNLMWRGDTLVAVIDWEDVAVGDPLSDLACARCELFASTYHTSTETFTQAYERHAGAVDRRRLATWEVYVSSAALTYMGTWGLPADVEAHRRRRTRTFLDRAAAVLTSDTRSPTPLASES